MATPAQQTGRKVINKFTTLEQLEQSDKGPVFVLNRSASSMPGRILITIPRKNGNGHDLVNIPKTFIPIDVSDQVPRSQLLESGDFRRTVARGLLKLLTPEYARLILATEDAREEQTRIFNEMQKARTAIQSSGLIDAENTVEHNPEDDEETVEVDEEAARLEVKRAKAVAKESADGVIPMRLKQLVANCVEEEQTQPQIIGALRRYGEDNWKKHELNWLRAKFKNQNKVVAYLTTQWNALKEKAAA